MGLISGLLARWYGTREGAPPRETWEDVRARWAKENSARTGPAYTPETRRCTAPHNSVAVGGDAKAVMPEDWPANQAYGPPLGAGGATIEAADCAPDDVEAVQIAELPPDLEDAIRQLRGWHHAGHGESCACRPCLVLRAKLAAAEVLGLVEHYSIAPYKK